MLFLVNESAAVGPAFTRTIAQSNQSFDFASDELEKSPTKTTSRPQTSPHPLIIVYIFVYLHIHIQSTKMMLAAAAQIARGLAAPTGGAVWALAPLRSYSTVFEKLGGKENVKVAVDKVRGPMGLG
jgi:hypothetical protein